MTIDIISNINLVRKLAWQFHRTNNIEFDELYSIGCLALCIGVKTYKKDKGAKPSTYLYTVVRNSMLDYIEKRYKNFTIEPSMSVFRSPPENTVQEIMESYYTQKYYENDCSTEVEQVYSFFQLFSDCEPLVREIVELVCFSSEPMKLNQYVTKRQITDYFRSKGFLYREIESAFSIITRRLKKA